MEDNGQLQVLLHELKQENSVQRDKIEKILHQLKGAQNEINAMTKVYEELGQKEMVLTRYRDKEKELIDKIQELESEIEEINEDQRNTKVQYENLIKESMGKAKHKVMESLPGLMHTSKHKVHIVAP